MGRADSEHGERTQTRCPCGIAMITTLEGDELISLRTLQPPVLTGDSQSDLDAR